MTTKQDLLNQSYASIIACDKAREILELYENGKRSARYDDQIFDYLAQQNGKGKFFLSSKIDRYIQEENKTEKQDSDPYFVLYLDELPVCLIRAQANEDPEQNWESYDYPINDKRFSDLIKTGKFYVLNASNYGLYLIGENDYYPVSDSPFEEDDFFSKVKKIGISLDDMKIVKNELDLKLIDNLDVEIREYDYDSLNEENIEQIKNFMEENGEDYKDCCLIGPIPMYQYGFISLNRIEVRDLDRENEAMCFKLVKNDKVVGYMHYDSYDEGSDSQISCDQNEADKAEKDIHKYYASLSPLGYIFEDKIVVEDTDDPDRSPIARTVAENIQRKIKKDGCRFGVYQLTKQK